jgi:uncharacterized phage protein gp47/JayE
LTPRSHRDPDLDVPFERPTLAELITRIGGDLRGRLEVEGPILRRAMADVLSAVWAGAVHTLYGYLDWLARQLFGDTAEREALLRKAALYGITPVPATFATGNVTATGTDSSSIPADTILRLDEATAYRVVTGQVIASGTATLPVIALLAGEDANLPEDAELTFESPAAGVDATATVAAGDIDGGVDEESTEELRDRYLLRLRQPPEGGADQDYEAWALAVAGVTRAWVYPHELGLGTVVVRFVIDDPDTGEVGFPDSGEVAAVQDALDEQRPITAEVTAAAPTELEVDFTIALDPDNADTRAAVEAEIDDLLRRVGEPGDGAGRGTVLLSKIRTAIGVAEDVDDYTLTVPSADVVPGVGELPVVGTITWV